MDYQTKLKHRTDESRRKNSRSKKGMFTGLLIITLGVLWMLSRMDVNMPYWLWSWQSIVILIGVFIGLSDNFRKPSSWILIGIGLFFLIDDIFYFPFNIWHFFWPVVVIIIGLIILIRPGKAFIFKKDGDKLFGSKHHFSDEEGFHPGDKLDIVAVFNGLKKIVTSRNFLGGEVVTVFGGSEINLMQADFTQPIKIEAVVIFGGLKLIVPRNWEVRTDVVTILAGTDDKRVSSIEVIPEDKILQISGVVIFGGIDIVSY